MRYRDLVIVLWWWAHIAVLLAFIVAAKKPYQSPGPQGLQTCGDLKAAYIEGCHTFAGAQHT